MAPSTLTARATYPASAHAAVAATAGDCTTFALAYATLTTDRALPTRIVTGFRVDADRLVRHRWTIRWTGRAWIAVAPAFGAVPARWRPGRAGVQDVGDIGLVSGDAALANVRAAAWPSKNAIPSRNAEVSWACGTPQHAVSWSRIR